MFQEAAQKEIGDAVKPYLHPAEFGPYLQVPSIHIPPILNISNHRPLGFTQG